MAVEQQLPDGSPAEVDVAKDLLYKRDHDLIPMAELTLSKRFQDLFAAPQKQHQGTSIRKPALPAEALDKTDKVILSELTAEANGQLNHG